VRGTDTRAQGERHHRGGDRARFGCCSSSSDFGEGRSHQSRGRAGGDAELDEVFSRARKNTGSVMPITSVVVPSGRYSFTAMPRVRVVSGRRVARSVRERTCARTGSPPKCAASRSPPAREPVKVAVNNTPLALPLGARCAPYALLGARSAGQRSRSGDPATPPTLDLASTPPRSRRRRAPSSLTVPARPGAPLVLLLHGFRKRASWRRHGAATPCGLRGRPDQAATRRCATEGRRSTRRRLVADARPRMRWVRRPSARVTTGVAGRGLTAADHPDRGALTVLSRPHLAAFARLAPTRASSAASPGDDAWLTDRWWADDRYLRRCSIRKPGRDDHGPRLTVERGRSTPRWNWYRVMLT
jgi:hypothetical protein